jgi:hypothetical protein
MDELKPDFQEVWETLRRNPQLALSSALFFGGILGLAFGVPAIAGALFGAGATMLGAWITSNNLQRSSAAEKAARESSAKRFLTPELKRVIDKVLHIHQRALVNYSSAAADRELPGDIQADFVPFMPVLYPNAPQVHHLTGDDAVALVEFYDSLHALDKLVGHWYDRPGQKKVNIYNVILHDADRSLALAQACVPRFDIDTLYPAKHESVGPTSRQIERALSDSTKAHALHIKRFNEKQEEEKRTKTLENPSATGNRAARPTPGGRR